MTLVATPWQTVGPFYSIGLTWAGGENLVPNRGDAIEIAGQVLDGDAVPVPDAMVEIWGRLELRLAENHSLKGKRQVVRSLSDRLRNQFNLAVAEVEANDVWQTAVLGLACVSNDSRHAHEMLEKAVDFAEALRLDAELVDYAIELLHVF